MFITESHKENPFVLHTPFKNKEKYVFCVFTAKLCPSQRLKPHFKKTKHKQEKEFIAVVYQDLLTFECGKLSPVRCIFSLNNGSNRSSIRRVVYLSFSQNPHTRRENDNRCILGKRCIILCDYVVVPLV